MLLYQLIIQSEHLEEIQEAMRVILESREPLRPGEIRGKKEEIISVPGVGEQLGPIDLPPAVRSAGEHVLAATTEKWESVDTPPALVPMKPINAPDQTLPDGEDLVCIVCGNKFDRPEGSKKQSLTCSTKCYMTDYWRKNKGKYSKKRRAPQGRSVRAEDKAIWAVNVDGKASTLTGTEERLNNMVEQYRAQGKVVEIISKS